LLFSFLDALFIMQDISKKFEIFKNFVIFETDYAGRMKSGLLKI